MWSFVGPNKITLLESISLVVGSQRPTNVNYNPKLSKQKTAKLAAIQLENQNTRFWCSQKSQDKVAAHERSPDQLAAHAGTQDKLVVHTRQGNKPTWIHRAMIVDT